MVPAHAFLNCMYGTIHYACLLFHAPTGPHQSHLEHPAVIQVSVEDLVEYHEPDLLRLCLEVLWLRCAAIPQETVVVCGSRHKCFSIKPIITDVTAVNEEAYGWPALAWLLAAGAMLAAALLLDELQGGTHHMFQARLHAVCRLWIQRHGNDRIQTMPGTASP